MAEQRSILSMVLRQRKEGEAAKQTQEELKKLGQASGEAGAAAQRLNLGMLAVKGAAISAGLAVLGAVPGLVNLGSESIRARVALEAMTGSSTAAAVALQAVERGAGGALDKLSAMQNATRLFSMGLANNAAEAEKLTQTAITLGATMGVGPQQAFEDFTLLLANQSILRLDTFGISGANVRQRMNELAEQGFAPADRQLRFLTATMEEADKKMMDLNDAGFEATTVTDRFGAKIETAKQQVGEFLARGLLPYLEIAEALPAIIRGNTEAIAESPGAIDGWMRSMQGAAQAAGEAAGAVSNLAVGTRELSAAQLGQQAMQDLNKALDEGFISQEQYDRVARETMGTLLGLPKAQIDANFAVREASAAFQEGSVGPAAYLDILQKLNQEMREWLELGTAATSEQQTIFAGAFQAGGQIPGPLGQPRLAIVHAGEQVVPVSQVDNSRSLLQGGTVNINNVLSDRAFDQKMRTWLGA